MQFVPNVALSVRNNIDRFLDKNLADLIRGIRNNKDNEQKYISTCIEEIKLELRHDSILIKANAIEKLTYLQMLGYDISWAAFNIIEVMASSKFNEKRIGYLAASQSFRDDTDVLMLTTNLIRKDLLSTNFYDVGIAIDGLSCFLTADLARDLLNDVMNLLSSSRTYIRKKAILLLYKMYLQYPESLKYTFPRLREKLEDSDPGVQSAAVNVICELARKNPKTYVALENVFFRLLNSSSNNWMLIKLIKLFGSLVPHEPKLGKKLLEPLTNLINNTSAMSLLYECINTVIIILISISTEGPGDYTPSIQLCVQKLGVLIDDSDQNLKYLGLLAMGKILQTHPKAVQAHKDIVLRCLDDKDDSIRLRALDLLYGMVSKKNIMEIVRKLIEHIDRSEGSFYRDELLRRIISICSYNSYQYITNFEWYISVLVELTKIEGSSHGSLIADQIQDLTVRVHSIRHFSVSQMSLLINNAQLLLAGNSSQRENFCAVLLTAAWVCGEFSEYVSSPVTLIESMLRLKLSLVPGEVLSAYIMSIFKLYSRQLLKLEDENDWDGVESLDNLLISKLPEFQCTDHLEAQERACNFVELLKFIAKRHSEKCKMGTNLAKLFEGELNPVAQKAQKKVPVPEGLNLDEPFVNLESSSSSDAAEEENEFSNDDGEIESFDGEDGITDDVIVHKKSESPEKIQASKRRAEHSKPSNSLAREENPYYLKLTAKDLNTTKNTAPEKCTSKKLVDGKEKQKTFKNPLEIPGIVGMEKWSERERLQIDWGNSSKKAVSPKNNLQKEKQKKKKQKSSAKKEQKERGGGILSTLSSSDSEAADTIDHTIEINKVEEELPEGALSSHDEEELLNGEELAKEDIELIERELAAKRKKEREQTNNLPTTEKSKKKKGKLAKPKIAVNGGTADFITQSEVSGEIQIKKKTMRKKTSEKKKPTVIIPDLI